MKIVLIGPPGSGKGSQSYFIKKKYNINKISTGDLVRSVIKKNNNFSIEINKKIKQGKLIEDEIIINLFKKEIGKKKYKNNFLIEGFPRTILQALEIKKMGISINYVINIKISDKTVFERINGRRIHASSGRIYHKIFNPPKFMDKDDVTLENLTIRKDDKYKIVKQRIKEYHKNIKHIRIFYQNEMKVGNLKYFEINGEKKIDNLKKEIQKIIKDKN